MSKPVKLYPTTGRYLNDVPAAVQIVETQKEADVLIATGAFTDNPNDAERDHDAPDHTKPPPEAAAKTEAPDEPGPSDSTSKE